MPIKIDQKNFKLGHLCPAVASCPVGTLTQKDDKTVPVVNQELCAQCQACISVCEGGEITWED